jgi:hypothetical protein
MADTMPHAQWTTEAETAHHEAGHHVAFRHLRPDAAEVDGGEISIIPNKVTGSVGHHSPDQVGPTPRYEDASEEDKADARRLRLPPPESTEVFDRQQVEDYIVEVYAGGAAGLHFDPHSRSAHWHLSDPTLDEEREARDSGPFALGGSDRYTAEAWLACIVQDREERAVLRGRLRERAVTFVAEHWEEISAIATALIERKRIDAVEARLIVRMATGDREAALDLDRYRATEDRRRVEPMTGLSPG